MLQYTVKKIKQVKFYVENVAKAAIHVGNSVDVFSAPEPFQKKNVITSTIQGNAMKKVFTTQSSSYSTLTLRRLNVRDIFIFEFVFFGAFLISLVAGNSLSLHLQGFAISTKKPLPEIKCTHFVTS